MRSETNRFPHLFLFPPFLEGWKGGLDSHGELWLLGNHPTNPRRSPGGSHDGPFHRIVINNGVKISSPGMFRLPFFHPKTSQVSGVYCGISWGLFNTSCGPWPRDLGGLGWTPRFGGTCR